MKKIELGEWVSDAITGFSGYVTGLVEYISGCNQALVQPGCKLDGDVIESRWFDLVRLKVDTTVARIYLFAAPTGSDREAPRR